MDNEASHVPTQSLFINHLHIFFNNSISGQSIRARGATALAKHEVPPHIIQACGQWASDVFLIYQEKPYTLTRFPLRPSTPPITKLIP